MQVKVIQSIIALGFLMGTAGHVLAQINNFAEDPASNEKAQPYDSEFPDIVNPSIDCPAIAEKYRTGGNDEDPLGYPADFGFHMLSEADKKTCISIINKDGAINEIQEAQEEKDILQD